MPGKKTPDSIGPKLEAVIAAHEAAALPPTSSDTLYQNVPVIVYFYINRNVSSKNLILKTNGQIYDPALLGRDELLKPEDKAKGRHLAVASVVIPVVAGGVELIASIVGTAPAPGRVDDTAAGHAWLFVKVKDTWAPEPLELVCDYSETQNADRTYAVS